MTCSQTYNTHTKSGGAGFYCFSPLPSLALERQTEEETEGGKKEAVDLKPVSEEEEEVEEPYSFSSSSTFFYAVPTSILPQKGGFGEEALQPPWIGGNCGGRGQGWRSQRIFVCSSGGVRSQLSP
jgi:hypothetical protein